MKTWMKMETFLSLLSSFYRKQCAEPVDFLRVLWASVFVEPHHELLTATK